jgi:hypothetical protein
VAGDGGDLGVVSGGDVVTVANLAPLTIALMVKPAIEKPEDLRGKKSACRAWEPWRTSRFA